MCSLISVPPSELCKLCDPGRFQFKSTAELPVTDKIIGQPRATRSIEFGIEVSSPGFNIYIVGAAGTGRTTTVERFLRDKASTQPTPDDWVYVQNFADERCPKALALPAGWGIRFCADLSNLTTDLKREIQKSFSSKEYQTARSELSQDLEKNQQEKMIALQHSAQEQGFALIRTPEGLVVVPSRDGEPMPAQEYQSLEENQRKSIETTRKVLEEKLQDLIRSMAQLEQQVREELDRLNSRVAASLAEFYFEPLLEKYESIDEVTEHLHQLRDEVVERVMDFIPSDSVKEHDPLDRFQANLLVDHSETNGAPVIVEGNPTYHNIIGRIEHQIIHGSPRAHFRQIKAGCLHKANGGYLVIRAADLVSQPRSWQAIRRSLIDACISIEEPATESIATVTLDPEPIPMNVKIILLGSPALYYAMSASDEEFIKLFKVKADFDADMERTDSNIDDYALFVAARCSEEELIPFDPSAVAAIVDFGAQLTGDQDRLSTRFGFIADVIREASFWAQKSEKKLVSSVKVQLALSEREYRANALEEQFRRRVATGRQHIETQGSQIGQTNGLYVVSMADHEFGQPSRITAQTYLGKAGVVSIEREVNLSGPIHNRGVLALAGYLGGTYAQDFPLSLSASITFEQNYGGIEGDSASSAELFALLSSLADIPLRQDIAISGSVDQWGKLQPIGGATEKIKGFFKTCMDQGLTGSQGVLLPTANARNLMLPPEVVEAVESGKFHIWTADDVDEGLELLTGLPAGICDKDGKYPENTVHHAVAIRLEEMAGSLRDYTT
ncbi:MAG: ATP-binding protein [Chloroflexota bacterium]